VNAANRPLKIVSPIVSRCLLTLLMPGLVLGLCALPAWAQVKTTFASSITSESMTPMWVARERGLFKKHGLDMQYVVIPRSPLAIAAIMAGEVDAAIIGPGHLINSASTGSDLFGVANIFQKLDYRLVARPEIKRVEDFRSKRVAISGPGATSHLLTMLSFQGMNLDPNQAKITLLTIPGTELNRRLAMESGSVDATTLRGAIGELYGNKGFTVLYNLKTTGVTLPQSVLVTSRRTAAAKSQVIEAYMRTMLEAIALTVDPANKSSVTRAIATNLRLTNPADAEEAYTAVVNSIERIPYSHLDSMKRLHQLLIQLNPKVADVRLETVIDNSIINKLESSGYIQNLYKK
jgi:ABC-type nitrate/sulfonate/bicarbonate transport system substrate-binding protein